ncbi:MAG: hypothetical protein JXR53_13515 [Bacteroidales bacterium]|nr:hypothetical protein [Bacteroidales bacterium]
MKKVLFLDTTHEFLPDNLKNAGFDVDYFSETRAELLQSLAGIYGLVVRSKFKIDREIIAAAAELKFIARAGAGMENIDVEYAESKGIHCFKSPEGNRDAVGEHALGMLLNLLNHLKKADNEVRNGIWLRAENRGTEISGKTVGIIGYGNMGSAFAEKLSGFSCRVIAYDKYQTSYSDKFVEEIQIEDLFRESDIVSLHVPLTEETEYMADADFFSSFNKNIHFINTSRGAVCNTAALLDAIDSGKVLSAALDVLEWEDHSFENFFEKDPPETFKKLVASDRVLLSPHIAGWTHESNRKHAEVLFEKIMSVS